MANKLTGTDTDVETGAKIHHLISLMSLKEATKNLPLEIQSYIGTFEARFYTLYWALRKTPKSSSFWKNKDDAYEILYGPKIKGRKSSSISLEIKVSDYFHVEEIRRQGKSLDDAIDDYMKKLQTNIDSESKNYARIKDNYYFVKPRLEKFLKSIN